MNQIITLNINLLYYNKKYPLNIELKDNEKELNQEALLNYQLLKGQVSKVLIKPEILTNAFDKIKSTLTPDQKIEIKKIPWCIKFLKNPEKDCFEAIEARNKYIETTRKVINFEKIKAEKEDRYNNLIKENQNIKENIDDIIKEIQKLNRKRDVATAVSEKNKLTTLITKKEDDHENLIKKESSIIKEMNDAKEKYKNMIPEAFAFQLRQKALKKTLNDFIKSDANNKLNEILNEQNDKLISQEKDTTFKELETKQIPQLINIYGAKQDASPTPPSVTPGTKNFKNFYLLKKQLITQDNIKNFQEIILNYIKNKKAIDKLTKTIETKEKQKILYLKKNKINMQ